MMLLLRVLGSLALIVVAAYVASEVMYRVAYWYYLLVNSKPSKRKRYFGF